MIVSWRPLPIEELRRSHGSEPVLHAQHGPHTSLCLQDSLSQPMVPEEPAKHLPLSTSDQKT